MAELAIGAVSLGIQVCQGIAVYIDALQCRSTELRSIKQQTDALQNVFQSIKSHIAKTAGSPEAVADTTPALRCLILCETELRAVDKLGTDLMGTPPSSLSSATIREKIIYGAVKLKYPMKQECIRQLQFRLERLSNVLCLALQDLDLAVSLSTKIRTDGLDARMGELKTSFDSLNGPLSMVAAELPEFRRLIGALEERLAHMNESLQASPAKQKNLVGHLASKPAFLKEFARVQALQSTGSLRTKKSSRLCNCRQSQLCKAQGSKWGPFWFYDKMASDARHSTDCKFFLATAVEQKRTRGLKFFVGLPTRLLWYSVDLSYQTTCGAGGYSISPNLTCYPTVDQRIAPAFRVLSCLEDCAKSSLPTDGTQYRLLIRAAVEKLNMLFRHGKASPKDVNQDNESLLHVAASMAQSCAKPANLQRPGSYPLGLLVAIADLANGLVDFGVPVALSDIDGGQALNRLFAWAVLYAQRDIPVIDAIMEAFYPGDTDFAGGGRPPQPPALHYADFYSSWPALGQAYHSPLYSSTLLGDVDAVKRQLNHDPMFRFSRTSKGFSNLHLAIYNPACLRVLLDFSDEEFMDQADYHGRSLLNFAIMIGSAQCTNGLDEESTSCKCTVPLRILLEAEWPFRPPWDFNFASAGKGNIANASRHCITELAKGLSTRRERLKAFALERLSTSDAMELGLHEPGLLDARAARVCLKLKQGGIQVPRSLAVYVPEDMEIDPNRLPYYRPVYCDLSCVEHAEIFYSHGFTDFMCIENGDAWGQNDTYYGFPLDWDGPLQNLPYAAWLMQHGFSIWQYATLNISLWGAPENVQTSGIYGAEYSPSLYMVILLVVDDMMNLDAPRSKMAGGAPTEAVRDFVRFFFKELVIETPKETRCCQCSVGSYGSFLWMIEELTWSLETAPREKFTREGQHRFQAIRAARLFSNYLVQHGATISDQQRQAAIRLLTFKALGTRHTCPEKGATLAMEEIREIHREEEGNLNQLADLIAEFEDRASGSSDSDMRNFWNDYWAVRMREVLHHRDMNFDWDENKRQTEALGVRWMGQEEPSSTDEEDDDASQDWGYWFKKIDQIE